MKTEHPTTAETLDVSQALLIVVGAHLRAEVADRPLAYHLQALILDWLGDHAAEINVKLRPVVCCDIWYVNQESLQKRPTISIGGPGVNALGAYYANRLQRAMIQEERAMIQLDPEFIDLRVSVWGMDHALTQQAITHFQQKYLEGYLRAVVTQVVPDEG